MHETYDANTGNILWQGLEQDARQNHTEFALGNGLHTTRLYDANNGYLLSSKTGTALEPESIQNLGFEFDSAGNIYSRSSQRSVVPNENLQEHFQYDDLHRLVSSNVTGLNSGSRTVNFAYNNLGNILTKSDASDNNGYTYGEGNAGVHAVTQVRAQRIGSGLVFCLLLCAEQETRPDNHIAPKSGTYWSLFFCLLSPEALTLFFD